LGGVSVLLYTYCCVALLLTLKDDIARHTQFTTRHSPIDNMVQATNAQTNGGGNSIIDIRDEALTPLKDQILPALSPKAGGEKKLPTLLLYNEEGLKLFEKITYLDEYYLTGQEIEVLEKHADHIADRIALRPDSMVIELGSGYASTVFETS